MVKPKPSYSRQSKRNLSASLVSTTVPSFAKKLSGLSVDQLLEKASDYENEFKLHDALLCYNAALERLKSVTNEAAADPNCASQSNSRVSESTYIKILESSAYVLLELGHMETAKKRFTEVLTLTNNPSYAVYMYLGQLNDGAQSLNFYRQGIKVISETVSHSDGTTDCYDGRPLTTLHNCSLKSLSRAESNAYCAIAELYMTDLCNFAEAESECRKAFEAATQVDPSNPQAWLTTANFYTVVANAQASRDAIDRCLDLWWNKFESVFLETEVDQSKSGQSDREGKALNEKVKGGGTFYLEEVTGIPSSGLIALVRMMLELEMNEKAATILESLLDGEEEDNPEVYYLLTIVGRRLWQEENPQLLTFYAKQTKVMASKLGDFELVEEMTLLLSELPQPESTPLEDSLSTYSTSDEEDTETVDNDDEVNESLTN